MSHTEILTHIQRILRDLGHRQRRPDRNHQRIDDAARGDLPIDRSTSPRWSSSSRRSPGATRSRQAFLISARLENSPDSTLNEHRSSVYSRGSGTAISSFRRASNSREQVARLVESFGQDISARRVAVVVTQTPDAAQIVAALAACEESRVPIVLAHSTLQDEDVRALCRTVGARVFLNNSLEWVSVPDAVEGKRCAFTVSLMTSEPLVGQNSSDTISRACWVAFRDRQVRRRTADRGGCLAISRLRLLAFRSS